MTYKATRQRYAKNHKKKIKNYQNSYYEKNRERLIAYQIAYNKGEDTTIYKVKKTYGIPPPKNVILTKLIKKPFILTFD